MVRLKGIIIIIIKIAIIISIPYGAIKSAWFPGFHNFIVLFQFLMVRLKGWREPTTMLTFEHFNSLWCD